jgi:ParB family chromosome partitioning protein
MGGVAGALEARRRLDVIPVAAVDLESHPFSPGLPRDTTALKASLETVGLLAPPHLRPRGDGRWEAVAGWKRLLAAGELGRQTAPAFLLPPETPEFVCLLISLHDNAARALNPWEQAFYAARLCEHLPPEDVARRYLPLLGMAPAPRLLERLLQAARLPDPWPPLMAAGRLSMSAAALLAGWPPEAQAAAWPYLGALPFTHRAQEEFLEGVELLARRQGVGLTDLLAAPELAGPLADPGLSPAARTEEVRRRLKEWLSPELRRAQAAFREGLRQLGLAGHPRLRLEPPPAFEGADFRLTVTFADAAELRRLLGKVQSLAATPAFSRPMDL